MQAGRFNFILLVQARSPGTSYLQLTERASGVAMTKLRDIMTQDLTTVPAATLKDVAQKMKQEDIGNVGRHQLG